MSIIFKMWFVAAILTIAATIVWSGKVAPLEQCPGESFEDLLDRVQVIPCGKSRCRLPRNTNATIILKFTTKKEVKVLRNDVHADIGGVPFPFIGVDGTDACQQLQRADTGEAVSCPLPAGHDYIYTNVFPILAAYPTLEMRVHWGLKAGKDSMICFEVPAAITSGSKKN